jgi:hypothetical protein
VPEKVSVLKTFLLQIQISLTVDGTPFTLSFYDLVRKKFVGKLEQRITRLKNFSFNETGMNGDEKRVIHEVFVYVC